MSLELRYVAHFGTFDIDNYGDLLFPHIVEHELAPTCLRVVHISPSNSTTKFPDCRPSISFGMLPEVLPDLDALILGGGHLIADTPTSLATYQALDACTLEIYPSLWIIPSLVAAVRRLPLCWNAPGVRRELSPTYATLLRAAARWINYIALRDTRSVQLMRSVDPNLEIELVPDTALGLPDVFPLPVLEGLRVDLFARRSIPCPRRSIVFHFKERYLTEPAEQLAKLADLVCTKQGATGILVALGPCHGDHELQHRIAAHMKTHPVLVTVEEGLLTHVACIATSDLYLGSSLHGLVTAIAYNKPAVGVADEERAGFAKFSGFLRQVKGAGLLSPTWTVALERAAQDLTLPSLHPTGLDVARSSLTRHWTRLRDVLTSEPKAADTTEPSLNHLREWFLHREWLGEGLRRTLVMTE